MKDLKKVILVCVGTMCAGQLMAGVRSYLPSSKYKVEAAETALWCAGSEKVYMQIDGEWMLIEHYTTTYDDMGNFLVRELIGYDESGIVESYARNTYVYGNLNRYYTENLAETSPDGFSWTNSELIKRRYDERVPSVVIENEDYLWRGVEWNKSGNNYRRAITRDANGNITEVEISVPYMGIYDPIDRLTLTYDDRNVAIDIRHEVLTTGANGDFVWALSSHYKNIVWNKFNGQVTNVEDLPTADNRMASAEVWVSGDNYAQLVINYTDDNGSFVSNLTGKIDGTPTRQIITQRVLDSYGSYERVMEETSGVGALTMTYVVTDREVVDAYGLPLEIYSAEGEKGSEIVYNDIKGTVEYDPVHGYPLVYVQHDDVEDADAMRVEYSDYVDAAGVADIEAETGAATYYNLRGIQLDSPSTPGIYIRRIGDRVDKVVVK